MSAIECTAIKKTHIAKKKKLKIRVFSVKYHKPRTSRAFFLFLIFNFLLYLNVYN